MLQIFLNTLLLC